MSMTLNLVSVFLGVIYIVVLCLNLKNTSERYAFTKISFTLVLTVLGILAGNVFAAVVWGFGLGVNILSWYVVKYCLPNVEFKDDTVICGHCGARSFTDTGKCDECGASL